MQVANELVYVAFWIGMNGLIFFALLMHVMRQRQTANVWTGDGGNIDLIRALRGKAVFLEYAPVCLLGLMIMAMINTSFLLIHFVAIVLTSGQLFHAIYVLREDGSKTLRDFGEKMSLAAVGLCGIVLLVLGLTGLT